MRVNRLGYPASPLSLGVGIIGTAGGLVIGILAGLQPLLLFLGIFAIAVVICFFTYFEQTVLGLLILRSTLDIFSAQQLPAVFAVGVDALTILYVALRLLLGQKIVTDKFFWLFAAWVATQGLWVILLPLGGLGLDGSYLLDGIREWFRLFSWLMIYLLVMQLQERIHPEKLISYLFLSLVIPLAVGLLQVLLPSLLPSFLLYGSDLDNSLTYEIGSRLNGTLGHPNTFATFLLFFIALACWKLGQVKQRWPWIILLCLLAFFLVSTKAIFILVMLCIFLVILIAPRLSLLKILGALIFVAIVLGIYASTEYGRERLISVTETPLLNPEISLSDSILLSWSDNNSFNWRIAQWTFLLESWKNSPLLGFGLDTSPYLSVLENYAHNDYIRALVETGVVGFTTFLAFLGAQFSYLINWLNSPNSTPSQRRLCTVLIALLIAVIIGMFTDNIWSHTTFFFYWWTMFAVAGWDWTKYA